MTEQTALAAKETKPAAVIWRGLLASALVILVVLASVTVKYIVNDDPSFAMMLSGSDGFPATADVPFVSRILAGTLLQAYKLAPGIPWYGISLYVSAWLGLGLLLSVPLSGRMQRVTALMLIAGWMPYLVFGLYNISMTNVTLWLQLGAILHLLFWLRSERTFRLQPGWLVAGLALGYLWRWEMFLVFVVFAAPLLFFVRREDLRKCCPVLIGLCLLVTIDRGWEFSQTQSQQQKSYQSFNRSRGVFHDRQEGQWNAKTEVALKKVGWSKNDYRAFHELWMLYDEKRVTESKLRKFVKWNSAARTGSWLGQAPGRIGTIFRGNKMYLPAFLLVSLALLVMQFPTWRGGSSAQKWRIACSLVLVLCGISAVCYVRFVSRVSFPLFAYWLGLLAVVGMDSFTRERVATARRVSLGVALALVFGGLVLSSTWARVDFSSLRTEKQQRQLVKASMDTFLAETAPENPLLIQLNPGVAIVHIGSGPLRENVSPQAFQLLPSGWNIRSPRYWRALEKLQVRSGEDVLKKSVNDPSTYFVLYARPWDDVAEVVMIWEEYFREHFQKEVGSNCHLEIVRQFENQDFRFIVYQMKSVPVPDLVK